MYQLFTWIPIDQCNHIIDSLNVCFYLRNLWCCFCIRTSVLKVQSSIFSISTISSCDVCNNIIFFITLLLNKNDWRYSSGYNTFPKSSLRDFPFIPCLHPLELEQIALKFPNTITKLHGVWSKQVVCVQENLVLCA